MVGEKVDNTLSRLRHPPRGEGTYDAQQTQDTPSLGGGAGERVLLTKKESKHENQRIN